MDILTVADVKFRIIEWEIGNTNLQASSVTIQIVGESNEGVDRVMDLMEEEAEKEGIEIQEGMGP